MNGVRVARSLFWRGAAPLLPSGALDTEALARALARAHFGSTRRFYSRAQHAVVVSRGVEGVAELNDVERQVIAMQAWLADIRATWLGDRGPKKLGGLGKSALRTLDVETLAGVFASVCRWGAAHGNAARGKPAHSKPSLANAAHGESAHEDAARVFAASDRPPRGAVQFEARLRRLAELGPEERRSLALYALLGEAVTAGLGIDEGEAVLAGAGLDPRIPKGWADSLRLVWRMADTAVRRDLCGAERPAFPALKDRIKPLEPEAAARCWLDRYRTLNPGDGPAARSRSAARGRSAVPGSSGNTDEGDRE